MRVLARIIYRFVFIPILLIGVHLAGLFNKKMKQAISGRYNAIRTLRKLNNTQKPALMIHASSLGEFEHIRPIIHRLGDKFRIIVTFFSASGFEHAKKTMPDEVHVYLPFDLFWLWKKIFKQLMPEILIISKHDVWPNQVLAAKKMHIPLYLVNASLSPKSTRLNVFYRFLLQEAYAAFDTIFTISEDDARRFKKYFKIQSVKVVGDTKFDQVLIRKEIALKKDLLKKRWIDKRMLVLGSIWPEDYNAIKTGLLDLMRKHTDLKVIAVPHQPSEQFVGQLLDDFSSFGALTFSSKDNLQTERALLLDVVGVLADLYRYAAWAYVGGSFKQGIHNVMEAAVYAIPVLFGPVYENSFEAVDLVNQNGALVVRTNDEFVQIMEKLMTDPGLTQAMGRKAGQYVQRKTGATDRLLKAFKLPLKT
ncbi:3-deoxy-D-manno-octulosonic acid transferase [Caldithrix abyssi]